MARYLAWMLLSLLAASRPATAAFEAIELHQPKPLPEFSLRDHRGASFERERLEGQWSMLMLGFTSCPHVCPMTLANLMSVRAELSLRLMPDNLPGIVFLAVDPERDQSALPDYMAHFHAHALGVTGDEAQIKRLVRGLGTGYRINKRAVTDSNYEVMHPATIFLIDPAGQLVGQFNPPFNPQELGRELAMVIRKGATP